MICAGAAGGAAGVGAAGAVAAGGATGASIAIVWPATTPGGTATVMRLAPTRTWKSPPGARPAGTCTMTCVVVGVGAAGAGVGAAGAEVGAGVDGSPVTDSRAINDLKRTRD